MIVLKSRACLENIVAYFWNKQMLAKNNNFYKAKNHKYGKTDIPKKKRKTKGRAKS